MKVGIGTYALFWEWNERCARPLTTAQQIERAVELGCDVFQICDDPTIPSMNNEQLAGLAALAQKHGIELELGTRGTDPSHLQEFIRKAKILGAHTLRSMVQRAEIHDGVEKVISDLSSLLPVLESAQVTLALETYEQVSTCTLVEIVDAINSPNIGICLDPANCVSALELPSEVISKTAAKVTNLHVKDFAFTRNEGWVGFTYAGAELGTGLLDLNSELSAVYSDGRNPSAIVEHWVVWQGDIETTIATERQWTQTTLNTLRQWRATSQG